MAQNKELLDEEIRGLQRNMKILHRSVQQQHLIFAVERPVQQVRCQLCHGLVYRLRKDVGEVKALVQLQWDLPPHKRLVVHKIRRFGLIVIRYSQNIA